MEKPVLSPVQRAWLLEIGMDARMLAHFSAEPFAQPAEKAVAHEAAQAPVVHAPVREQSGVQQPAVPRSETPGDRRHSSGPALISELLKRAPVSRPAAVPESVPQQPAAAGPGAAQGETLPELRLHAEQCQACGLHEVRGRVVFGEGVETAPRWLFIGEAPGEYDDTVGRPFQGRAGDLLREMLASVGIADEASAYFTNVLKCRPMGNRSPQASEVEACLPVLRQQIRLLQPACLVALGRVSAGTLLGRDADLDDLREQVHRYVDEDGREIPLVVTHHPAALLLHGQLKAEAWRDLNLLVDLPR